MSPTNDLDLHHPCPECRGVGGVPVDSMDLYGIPGGFDWTRCEVCRGEGVKPLTPTTDPEVLGARVILWTRYRASLGYDFDRTLTMTERDRFRDWVRDHRPDLVDCL